MVDREILLDLTETYLKSLIAEVANSSVSDTDSFTPFQELGIDSFHVLEIVKKLEDDFGSLPKTLLFENFNINDLAHYFVDKHEQTLAAKFEKELQASDTPAYSAEKPAKPVEVIPETTGRSTQSRTAVNHTDTSAEERPILILEKEAYTHPELGGLLQKLFDRYGNEGSVSRGTRNIAPNLFIGSEKRGYFNYSRSNNIILVYTYTGPDDYFPVLAQEMQQYCAENNFELNIFSVEQIHSVGNIPFSATPFGVAQRITNLQEFTLRGNKMRRLRYQVSKFERAGDCKTVEYRSGSDMEIARNIAEIIDKWCAARTMVNPLIHIVREEILTGTLNPEHRIFLTYLDDVLQNVILITPMPSEENAYLMDLEFYPEEMPLGGLEYGIVKMIEVLVAEGCTMLSLGGTYGCKLAPSSNADPEVDRILDKLREQNIFNDEGNLQFKRKFRPETQTIFLCRPVENSNPDNVTEIIMMIADPEKMQTSEEENQITSRPTHQSRTPVKEAERPEARRVPEKTEVKKVGAEGGLMIDGEKRSGILSDFGYNPLNIPHDQVEFDLKTDSWAQLEMPAIEKRMRHLHARLQQPVDVDESLRGIFPFTHFVLTPSGRTAEHVFYKAWEKKGIALQNLLFPTTIYHQIDKGFTPTELPHPEVFQLDSAEVYKGNLDWQALQKQVEQAPESIALVCVEVNDNAAGGYPVSIQHLKKVQALLSKHSLPLVIDGTRILENAAFLLEHEDDYRGKTIWEGVHDIFSCADTVVASLTKDFCVNKGGLIATNDAELFARLQEIIQREGGGLDVIDKKVIALSLQNRQGIETQVLQRIESVQLIWNALRKHDIPVIKPAGRHCVLIDVKQIPEFKDFEFPVASFVAWVFLNTGIRVGAHNTGMQKNSAINNTVRLAIPVGLEAEQVQELTDRLVTLFERKENIPEIVKRSEALGDMHARFTLKRFHNASGNVIPKSSASTSAPEKEKQHEDVSVSSNFKESESIQVKAGKESAESEDVAIVGMAGRYPKSKNLDELWKNLVQGRDCIETIPDVRLAQRLRNEFTAPYRGGFIDDVDKFDSMFFNISPREAEIMDPQERLFLEAAWEAIEDAGYYPEILAQEETPRNIGVFVGAVWAMYQMIGAEEKMAGNNANPNSFLWSIANRVSYWMSLTGPSITLDTACSSSLTAIYLACEALHKGDCSAAIVGGVNLDLHQSKWDINWAGGALSKDGVSRSFGKDANGYVAGEGVGAIFLKPLKQAIQDKDNIYGVIKSVVVNHGGKTSGYTVPNPKAQTRLISSALEKAKIDARTIGYIEAHGTGTELGDPIEITGLTNAFEEYNVENQSCPIGSIKSNIGHLEAAAGVVSVSKVLLQMKHRKLVPSLHSSELNEHIDFENSPFYVEQEVEDWEPKEVDGVRFPLRAGISSFGAGGANAHLIIEQYETQPQEQGTTQPEEKIFPLSARNEEQLREMAVRLREFIQQEPDGENPVIQQDVNDIAYTLQFGRKSFDCRLVVVAKTKEELAEKLSCFIEGKQDDNVLAGQVKNTESITRLLNRNEKEEFINLVSQSRNPHKLAQLWIDGLLTDWQGFQSQAIGRRISLPTYPFADKRHWVERQKDTGLSLLAPGMHANVMHPLIDSNESTFERQIFKKTFHDKDFFIYDHHVSDIPTLPGVGYLDLARKAGEIAAGRKVQKIKNIVWVSPLTVENSTPTEAFIELKPNGNIVQFEVFSEGENSKKQLYSQGKLAYASRQEAEAEPEYIDLEGIRSRCSRVMDGKEIYPLFKKLGLNLGPSFQVVKEIFQNEEEVLGVLKIPEIRQDNFQDFVLHPSLVDGSLQAGMGAQLGDTTGEMFVPYSIGEIEILHPLQPTCYSYFKLVDEPDSNVSKANVFILDEDGKILVKIRDSIGVPLLDLHERPAQNADDGGEFSKLYYTHIWEESPLEADNIPEPILIFDTDETLRELYRDRLEKSGAKGNVILVQPGKSYEDLGEQTYKIDPQSPQDYTQLFESLKQREWNVGKICYAWSAADFKPEERSLKASLEQGVYAFFYLSQALIEQKFKHTIQLLYLYLLKKDAPQPHNDAINGFVRTLQIEHPKLYCKILQIQQAKTDFNEVLDTVLTEFHPDTQDSVTVRYEEGQRFVRTVKKLDLDEMADQAPTDDLGIKEKGVYLITGGAGGLGLIFADFLAKECSARLLLTGRSDLSKEREAKLEELGKSGAEVLYLQADVSKHDEVTKLIQECKSRFGEIDGIIHSAGVLRDSYIRNKTVEEMEAVFAPKVFGTLYLDEATKNENLDFFVTFSSMAAVGGNIGQSDYAFANHFMDSFISRRELLRTKGERAGKSLSLNWSIWADGGMKLDEQTEIFFKRNLGINPLRIETGLEAFVKGLASTQSQLVVVEGVPEKIERTWEPRIEEPPVPASSESESPAASESVAQEEDGELLPLIQDTLSQIVMDFLKLDPDDVDQEKILLDLGFDSIGLTTYANSINEKYQLDITPVLFFEYPSIKEIAKYLATEHKDAVLKVHQTSGESGSDDIAPSTTEVEKKAEVETPEETSLAINKGWEPADIDQGNGSLHSGRSYSPERRFVDMPMAVVGIGGVMPESEDMEEFWENLRNAKNMVTVIPRDRWKWEDYDGDPFKEENKTNSKWGGFIKDVDKFDPLFFGISPREAQMMDPQQRIFLETVWETIEDSGHKVSDLSGTKTGLFVGAATRDYTDLMGMKNVPLDGYSASGNSHSILVNRISFLLNLRGPSAPLDTACSSSLVALHRAIESIHTGSCDMAIVGGVQAMLTPGGHISFGMAGMMSDDGKCKTFDKRADGYVRGEGSGAIFIKPLEMAEADGNHIYAVIKATAENHGGRVTMLTAPNPNAQSELLIEAYEKAQVDPATVGYIECHGTGTSLGDPIEVQALDKAFSELYTKHNNPPAETPHCGLSSVKTNIGHLETAAGVAGVLKAILAIKHKQIPALLHFEELNPYINLGKPFYIVDKTTPWEAMKDETGRQLPRRAGVSSFGFGGANAHVVLEEYLPSEEQSVQIPGPHLIVLSAKNKDRLKDYAQRMLTYIEKHEFDLADFAYTLQVGRDEMPERLAFVAQDIKDLKEKFAGYLHDKNELEGLFCNNTQEKGKSQPTVDETSLQELLAQKELTRLAELWVSGVEIDWSSLYTAGIPKRMSLPTYPFARERHWFSFPEEELEEKQNGRSLAKTAVLHPLVHRNVSTLSEQKFASRFTGTEFFFTDHMVETQKILPGVAYLEMARVAGELSGETPVQFIRNLVWMRPITIGADAKEVEVSLAPNQNEVDFTVKTIDAENTVNCEGKLAYSGTISEPEVLDISGIQERCSEKVLTGTELYSSLRDSGLKLGKGFQIVQEIYATESESLAILKLPEHLANEASQFWLHPALMDGSLHTAIGLMEKCQLEMPISLPFSVAEVQIIHDLKDLYYGYATWAVDDPLDDQSLRKIDYHLLDKDGKVLIRMKDFILIPLNEEATTMIPGEVGAASHEANKVDLQSFVPVWDAVRTEPDRLPESTNIHLLGGDQARLEWVQQSYPNTRLVQLPSSPSIDIIQEKLKDCSPEHLLWMAPDVVQAEPLDNSQIVAQQEQGVLTVFRIVKALLHLGYGSKELHWTIITSKTQAVKKDEDIASAHAGLVGLVGSLAKEFPNWKLRLLDIDSLESLTAHECLSQPSDRYGNGFAYRRGEWFRQGLARLEISSEITPVYKQNGVYVVIGGAGGLGEVWTRFMIERYQAKIVWIGRRELNDEIEDKINSLSRLGQEPAYISADATQLDSLQKALTKILEMHPTINGVVHSAIVLNDQSIATMDESGFTASLSAKVDISVNMDRVFGELDLDFMLFFSSIISFIKTPGQSNYAAGCTFKDSFAQRLQQHRPYPVKIMNWGYWGNVGIVADESYKKMMEQMGIGSIEPDEGMASLQALLGSEFEQIALLKTLSSEATAELSLPEMVTHYPQTGTAVLPQVQSALSAREDSQKLNALEGELSTEAMDAFVTEILLSSLVSLGLFNSGVSKIADLSLDKPPAPFYQRWLDSTIRYLQEQDLVTPELTLNQQPKNLTALWKEWETRKAEWSTKPHQQAQTALLEACLKALPDILSGKQTATDVMFPRSSMELVEGIYRGNPIADYFNDVLGETLSAWIKQKLQADNESKIRILEIGAGTGGTTALLLPLLEEFGDSLAEYCYTDISKAFLMFAEEQYQQQCSVLTTAIFDVSQPIASQSIATNQYDLVVAANVLHATPNIRETLRNAKAPLKRQGVLLLNEISTWSLFTHLTFGLLEGWWLHEDTELRLSGSPGLTPQKWQEILSEEGFEFVFHPAQKAHKFGQQIIAASSDGVVRQRISQMPSQPPANVKSNNVNEIKQGPRDDSSPSADVTEQMRHDYIEDIIIKKLSESLKIQPDAIRNDVPFADYGVDSIIGVNFVRTVSETLQIELEPTSLFEYSSVDKLAGYILSNWEDKIAEQLTETKDIAVAERPSPPESTPASEEKPVEFPKQRFIHTALPATKENDTLNVNVDSIAVIGMSGRFAQSESLEEFWQNLKAGKDLVKEVSRWQPTECVISDSTGNGYCSKGSFVDSIDRFDPEFFGISQAEALYMDPQQRLFLEEAWKALEDAGYAGQSVHEKECGIYVGCGAPDYGSLFMDEPPAHAFWGNSASVIPARIAYYLNLRGPAVAVDTACSSSLVSIHLACQGLWSQETEMALAGGVYLQATPGFYQVANRAGLLSPKGKCHTFDARADGFVPGEGVGVVVLKRLKDALQDGDFIYGVISGSGINQDGASNGLIAPNAQAQEKLESSVYERFNIKPETIQVVEAHGTGTALGDSIEFGAITRSFRKYTDKKQFCAMGSVKTNIGHAATAAGVSGVLKLLLSFKHRQIPPSLHFEKSNPAISFESSPFYVNTELQEWQTEDKQRRRAAISSFGFSGTNAHMVIEEAPEVERIAIDSPGYLVVLSARTSEQLKQQVQNLLEFAKNTPELSMNDLSYSLFVGRKHLAHRFTCVARSRKEMIHFVEQWLQTGNVSQIYTSEMKEGKIREQVALKKLGNQCIEECRDTTNAAQYLENLTAIAELYIQGYSLDFHALFSEDSKRIPLPTYPFAKERYWFDGSNNGRVTSANTKASVIHPLLHTNTSDLSEQSYHSTFNGEEFFLKDHRIEGQKTLPGVAYLEMVRAAVEQATHTQPDSKTVELCNIIWAQPIVVTENKQVRIALLANEDGQIDYEIYSQDEEREVVHCQGYAILSDKPASTKLDIKQLKDQMTQGELDASEIYATFANMGIHYGPAHQGITAIFRGEHELLAQLSLPAAVTDTYDDFLLHPSMMDSALQAGLCLIAGPNQLPSRPSFLHSLESLNIISACTKEMIARVRYSQDSNPEAEEVKLDLDLIDSQGHICVQLQGLSYQAGGAMVQDEWVFSVAESDSEHPDTMAANDKIELFVKQEIAQQLQKTVEEVAADRNYIELGVTSIGITELIQKLNHLLGENLSPSLVFEYTDIQKLADYVASTYPEKVRAIVVKKQEGSPEHTWPELARLPRQNNSNLFKRSTKNVTESKMQKSDEQILEEISWQDNLDANDYEKVAF